MNTSQRREKIAAILNETTQPLSASALAEKLQVSRQVIVGDIALLRAGGRDILSTPRGYLPGSGIKNGDVLCKIACLHNAALTKTEIYTIVDYGGKLVDVMVEHPIYGQLTGQLNIGSRYEADDFLKKVQTENTGLLSDLTGGIHLHTVSCKDEETARRIKEALRQMDILLDEL